MSEETATPDLVELVRSFLDTANQRDFAALMSYFAEDAVWGTRIIGVFEGRAAIRSFIEAWFGTYQDYEQSLEEVHELANGVTVSVVVAHGKHGESGSVIEQRIVGVGTWRDGLIKSMTTYGDIVEGRAAAERLAEERG